MSKGTNRLGDLLLEAGLIDQFQLNCALSMQRNLGGQLGAALIKLGYLPESTILEFLEAQQRYARINPGDMDIDPALMKLLPVERMRLYQVIPVDLRGQGHEKILRLAMSDPTDRQLIDDLQFTTGCKILPLLASANDILRAIETLSPTDAPTDAMLDELERAFTGSFSPAPRNGDDRLGRLLEILLEKGILNLVEVERINGD